MIFCHQRLPELTQVSAVFTVAKAAEGDISFEARLWNLKLQLMYIAKEWKVYFASF